MTDIICYALVGLTGFTAVCGGLVILLGMVAYWQKRENGKEV